MDFLSTEKKSMSTNKKYFFISGLPRSGSTLLTSILNQNPQFHSDIQSPLSKIVYSTLDILSSDNNNHLIDLEQRKNILNSIFNGYYQNINEDVIFNTSRYWTKKTELIKNLFPYTKVICCVRNIKDILNSFENLFQKNCFYENKIISKTHKDNIFARCDNLMELNNGTVGCPWIFLKESLHINKEMILLIEYEDLCKKPHESLKKIYDFIKYPYYNKHNFENLQFSKFEFDLSHGLIGLHSVSKKIEYSNKKFLLPEEIVKKYSNMEFWRY